MAFRNFSTCVHVGSLCSSNHFLDNEQSILIIGHTTHWALTPSLDRRSSDLYAERTMIRLRVQYRGAIETYQESNRNHVQRNRFVRRHIWLAVCWSQVWICCVRNWPKRIHKYFCCGCRKCASNQYIYQRKKAKIEKSKYQPKIDLH